MIRIDIKEGQSCDYHRIDLPFRYINASQFSKDIIVFNRVHSRGSEYLRSMKAQGMKIVMDVDDFWHLTPNHYLHDHFRDHVAPEMMRGFSLADMVIVTNEVLAAEARAYHHNVVIVPNALPVDYGQFVPSRNPGITVVYGGGPSHYCDLAAFNTAFNRNEVTIVGLDRHPEWRKIVDLMPNATYNVRRDLNNYMDMYDGHVAALAPLIPTPFNKCKSNLKMLEAGVKCIPLIASKTHPYYNQKDKDFVLYAENSADWSRHIDRVIRDRQYSRDLGLKLASHVRDNYNLFRVNNLRVEALRSL